MMQDDEMIKLYASAADDFAESDEDDDNLEDLEEDEDDEEDEEDL